MTKIKGLVFANYLLENDEILMYNSTGIVIDNELSKLNKEEITYNFEVEDYHTYFVGNQSMLVHNDCKKEHIDVDTEKQAIDKADELIGEKCYYCSKRSSRVSCFKR